MKLGEPTGRQGYPALLVIASIVSFLGSSAWALHGPMPQLPSVTISVPETEAARFRFETLLHSLEANYETQLRNTWTTLGFNFLGIGWLLTSDAIRRYLS